jgi:acyl dehydratase
LDCRPGIASGRQRWLAGNKEKKMNSQTGGDGLVIGKITDLDIEMMRRRIGYPNPTLRKGVLQKPWNTRVNPDAVRRWAECVGDMNPLYNDEDYAAGTRWGPVAPPGFEWSMGIDRNPIVSEALNKETHRALRGVQLYHSGAEYFYYLPMNDGVKLFKSECVGDVTEKQSRFATRSVIVDNVSNWWDAQDQTYVRSSRWFVHAERKPVVKDDGGERKAKPKDPLASYTDDDLALIEQAYDNEYIRGADTLFYEDVNVGDALPTMVKGPLTITDMINLHMGGGWLTYGNPPYRLAYENRKKLRGFYSKNEFGAWDTLQRVHWDIGLAHKVGVQHTYDIGPMRFVFVCNYLSNYAGDDAFVHRIRYELRSFNYVGDTTWITARITDKRIDPALGPLIELEIKGTNQRGQENITASATILVASRQHGLAKLPPQPEITSYRRLE